MTGANFQQQLGNMDSITGWIHSGGPSSLSNSSDLNNFFEKVAATDSSDANEILSRLQHASTYAEEPKGLRVSLIKQEQMASSWDSQSISGEPSWGKLSSSTNGMSLTISSGISSLRQSTETGATLSLTDSTSAVESVIKLVQQHASESTSETTTTTSPTATTTEQTEADSTTQETEIDTNVGEEVSTTTTTIVESTTRHSPSNQRNLPLHPPSSTIRSISSPSLSYAVSPIVQVPILQKSFTRPSYSNHHLLTPVIVPEIPQSIVYSTPVRVHDKPQVFLNLEQLSSMIDCGAQLNMNALVGLNFEHEGKPFGLKLSILLQLLLHQAAYAYWMGKKSAPTASRNCRFEGATKGQTKYPKRKFCGWVNKVAEVTRPYGQESLCMALQELWSLLRLSPQEMDCTQNDNIKRVLGEFFRVHNMVIANGTQHTVTQLWINVLTTAAKPEVFMRRDEGSKRKRKGSKSSPEPLDEDSSSLPPLEDDEAGISIKDEQHGLVALNKRRKTASPPPSSSASNPTLLRAH
jgi:hypothetical protein